MLGKKYRTTMLAGVLILALSVSACGSHNDAAGASQAESSQSSVAPAVELAQGQASEDSSADPVNKKTEFTVNYFGEAAEEPLTIALDLPEGWVKDAGGIFDGDRWVAGLERQPVADARQPFADIDTMYDNVVASKEMTVAGYPAKCYALEMEMQIEDSSETAAQYLYYILLEDSYVLLYFSADNVSDTVESSFDEIVSSFRLV